MAVKKPAVVYGGPYATETDAITAESTKETPDYDNLVSGWKTISQGAVDYIAKIKKPIVAPVGEFSKNVILKEEEAETGQTEIDLEEL